MDQLKSEVETVMGDGKDEPNPVRDNMQFSVSHEIACVVCGNVVKTRETCLDLPLFWPTVDKE